MISKQGACFLIAPQSSCGRARRQICLKKIDAERMEYMTTRRLRYQSLSRGSITGSWLFTTRSLAPFCFAMIWGISDR